MGAALQNLALQSILHNLGDAGHPHAHAIGLVEPTQRRRPRGRDRIRHLKREKHACKVIVIRGDALSCVLVGVLVVSRLPAYGQAVLRFLRDLNKYRDGS
jgi:hypothetical protein